MVNKCTIPFFLFPIIHNIGILYPANVHRCLPNQELSAGNQLNLTIQYLLTNQSIEHKAIIDWKAAIAVVTEIWLNDCFTAQNDFNGYFSIGQ
ncbi:MAG: hypothetical protein AMJ53_08800 [Gammaproteobacteria bacterium SG8_11]|nr:MAG: hypothetical protein AMJ53_08800 [Gammaproteobacteria bacterium SG8_11]